MNELKIRIKEKDYDIIAVNEIKPKHGDARHKRTKYQWIQPSCIASDSKKIMVTWFEIYGRNFTSNKRHMV